MDDKKSALFHAARELFYSKGFKDTNVSEITKSAGVAVGTFYNYYASKEQLFMEIFIRENDVLKRSLLESFDINGDPVTEIKKLLSLNFSGTHSNPILREWYNRELMQKLETEFYRQGGMTDAQELMDSGMRELIRFWKADGKLRDDLDDELILAIFKSIPYVDLHKEDIGTRFFPQIMDLISEFIMKGLSGRY
jgi:AcrR family transcriptional regulator